MSRTITLNHLTKIEGHAKLSVTIEKGRVVRCELGSTEGARFFEGLVVGRHYDDACEMTMRICGICSVAHFTASVKALEDAMNVRVSRQALVMREVMAIGERLRSHATHLYFLSLPDFLGYESALAMAPRHKEELDDALHLMRTGNEVVRVFGGRQIHPMGGRVGGFTHYPGAEAISHLLELFKKAERPARRTLSLFLKLDYPGLVMEREHLSLEQRHDFPLLTGRLVAEGRVLRQEKYERYFREYVNQYSTAKFVARRGKSFMLGALPRVNNNWRAMDEDVRRACRRAGITFPSKNPFHNLVAQAVELVHWVRRGRRLLHEHRRGFTPEQVSVKPVAGTGIGVVEAPRGVLFHTYTINKEGKVRRANIMTPTSQNLKAMEEDLKAYLQQLLDHGVKKSAIPLELEKLIRAYDPCFSCSTHFLRVEGLEE